MKALVCREYGPPDRLVIETQADPVPGPGEVLVRVMAAGINFFDLLAIAGNYQIKSLPPFVPGNEAAGFVLAVGEGVSGLNTGDRVIITPTGGAFAEKCVLPEKRCLPLPAELSYEQGAGFILNYATSYHALRQRATLEAGETLLVLGAAGGCGIAAVEIAKALGATVIAAASSDEKGAFARDAGADFSINYSIQPLREAVRELTNGAGVDVVYDPVGGESAQAALRSLAWRGRYLVIGFASGTIPQFPANIVLLKEASIMGVYWGEWSERQPRESLQNLHELRIMASAGKLRPRVTGTYPLEQFRDAFATVTGRRVLGKVVLIMPEA